jgi:hypothetical protein
MLIVGIGANVANYKIRQRMNVDGEIVEKNNLVLFHAFLQDSAGHNFSVPVTQHDLMVYKNFNVNGIHALSTDTSRAITAKDRGKQVLIGYGYFKI